MRTKVIEKTITQIKICFFTTMTFILHHILLFCNEFHKSVVHHQRTGDSHIETKPSRQSN
jgi:hypothetical protein